MWTKFCWRAAGDVGKTYVKLWLVSLRGLLKLYKGDNYRIRIVREVTVYLQTNKPNIIDYLMHKCWNPGTFTRYIWVLNRLPLSTSYPLECLQGKTRECVSYPCDCPWNPKKGKTCYWERVIFAKLHKTGVILGVFEPEFSDTKFIYMFFPHLSGEGC